MRVLQANMHRSNTANALIEQLVVEKDVDVVIISEQNKSKTHGIWLGDVTGTAAVWLPSNSKLAPIHSGVGDCFVYVQTKELTLMSCYLTPSDRIEEFQRKLDLIEDKAVEIGGPLLIAGDFNSKATEWGMKTTNSRGRRVLDMTARLGLIVANTGTATTFRRPGCEETTPDITLVSEDLYRLLKEWKVLEDFTGSDHQYITYSIRADSNQNEVVRNRSTRKWNVSRLKTERLLAEIDKNPSPDDLNINCRTLVDETIKRIIQGCNGSMPKVGKNHRKQAVYWWTAEIAQRRTICLSLRRKLTRARKTGLAINEGEELKQAKKVLKLAIIQSKKVKFEELRNDLNCNPWGLGYRIVMQKLGAKSSVELMDGETTKTIVDALFPTHAPLREEIETNTTAPAPFEEIELMAAVKTLKGNKAPGPDGIPTEVFKIIAAERPRMLLDMYNACLQEGVFPEVWKTQKLVLLSKGKGNSTQPSAYRPLCMLNVAGKLFEKMLKPRLAAAIENSGGLSKRQYGFRPGKSTLGAIEDVIASVKQTRCETNFLRRVVLLATLDIRNAFNSLRWANIIEAIQNIFEVPGYLLKVLQSYLKDRELLYDTSDGMRRKKITSGAAQGSILGPDLWNITYDEILRIEMPDDTYLVGYADDIAAVITARNTEEAKRKLNQVMLRTRFWLEAHGLSLATEKTELILLTKRHIQLEVEMKVFDTCLTTTKELKYLGVRFDPRMNFRAQINHAASKAAKVTGMLSKLMANVGGPTQSKRKLLMETTNSILLYGCEVWGVALEKRYQRKTLLSVQRTAALRVASAYRTVSVEAVLVISGVIPIDLLVQERQKIWEGKKDGQSIIETDIRNETLLKWQERWETERCGRWTAKLIPNLRRWIERDFGEGNYYLTQFLSGHGYFRKYLHRMGKVEHPTCIFGDADIDDAEHTFFKCEKWRNEREALELRVGACNAENIIEKMTQSDEYWKVTIKFIEDILRKKKICLDEG